MRIISGKDAGRYIFYPKGGKTRPTQDRVKESFFNIINKYIQSTVCLDLFTGSGSIGLEFISRGADFVYFCDIDGNNIRNLKRNIEILQYQNKSKVDRMDFRSYLNNIEFKHKIDIAYIDPPYGEGYEYEAINLLKSKKILSHRAFVVVESSQDLNKDKIKGYKIVDIRKYGKANLSFLKEE